ncbi:2-oxo-4-hydroxy-4-carboxy-5-ureidoimidazoline decarboxylase [Phormidium sp. LEGE 05292]|uniref:2-oxo-4-hydroxy-4-carboxy-5-ureidoimidazoline decarboxylase n=1 Tax=[Phormidium] sp. LEGE 05292 TaxID=767427 RepID=UPI00187FF470|nr:2-oxo-4-hydroxy-4-carboxy-5-ureidoimidazoline decarboxylase [Phormidium sp. LEGE 05292]MBE9226388.1 2-oxo-4-hydroxy-4-carboxy-5-ureidoimidazoline decarboxylase [Phormidium sp. LEGE 05292]
MKYTIFQLNQMDQEAFTEALATIFEHSPWVAKNAWQKRPFADLFTLHQNMIEVVQTASKEQQLNLICAHPDLGTKAKMAEASVKEQTGVGLDRLTLEEYQRFHSLNQTYKEQFGFPFIIAVKNHTKDSILTAFEQRIKNSPEVEIAQALTEIAQIAKFRLEAMVIGSR